MSDLEGYLRKIDKVAPDYSGAEKLVHAHGFELKIAPGVWDPSQGKSSPMFARILENYPVDGVTSALDLGTGSGILALILNKKGISRVIAADKSAVSVSTARENFERNGTEIVVVESDLFDCVAGRFDLVVFNAPATHPLRRKIAATMPTLWSPEENIIQRFLDEWKNHKTPNGRALVMYSKFPDFDPLDGETLKGFQSQYLQHNAGELSESGVLEVWE